MPFLTPFLVGRVPPPKRDYRKKRVGTLVPTSLLDLDHLVSPLFQPSCLLGNLRQTNKRTLAEKKPTAGRELAQITWPGGPALVLVGDQYLAL